MKIGVVHPLNFVGSLLNNFIGQCPSKNLAQNRAISDILLNHAHSVILKVGH